MNLVRQLLLGGALYAVPALALAAWLRGTPLVRWCLALALSPVALGLAALPLRLAGMGAIPSGLSALGFWAAMALASLRALPRGFSPEERSAAARAACLLPLVALPPLINPYLFIRSDAWFHAGVTAQVKLLPLPPQDPYFAGLSLQYFWFFHHVLGIFDAVAHVGPFTAMWLFNCAYFALTLLGAYRLARVIGASHPAALWSFWFVAAGANAAGWGWVLVHAFKSPEHWAAVSAALPDYVLNLVNWRYVSGSAGFALDKFLVGTAFSWGIAFFIWWAAVAAEFWERGGRALAVSAGLLVLAALLVHTVAGFTACWAGALGVVLALLTRPSRAAWGRALGLGFAMALGVALAYPYLHSVTQSKAQGGLPHLGPNVPMVWTTFWVALGFLPFLALSVPALWRAGEASRWTLLLTLCLGGVACLMRLTYGNESKFLHLTLLPLAGLVGPCARAWLHRIFPGRPAARAGLMLAAFAPTTALVLACLLVSHGNAALRPEPPRPGAEEKRLYDWVRRSTPVDAVVLAAPGSLQPLVRAQRAQLWSKCSYDVLWGYPQADIAPRRDATVHAFESGLTPADLEFLRSLRRPVYRITRVGLGAASPRFEVQHREGPWVAERLNLAEAS